MAKDGWVKLYRKITEWGWYNDSHMVHLLLHLIISANREHGIWRGISIENGQLVCGLPSLSKATGISIQRLRTCLQRLETGGEITRKSTNRFSIITICKYEEYQSGERVNQQASNRLATGKQQASNNKQEVKEVKKEKNKEKDIGGKFVPPSVDEVRTYCLERGNSVDPEKLIDYYTANGWMVGRNKMRCWKATVRTWEKNSHFDSDRKKPMTLKQQQARELLGYGTETKDS